MAEEHSTEPAPAEKIGFLDKFEKIPEEPLVGFSDTGSIGMLN